MHIKSIPARSERVLKLAADLQAALLFRGWVSELVYMQRCWPQNCFQHCGSWWIQMRGKHDEDELNNSSVVLLVQRNPKPLLQPFPLTPPWTWDCPVGEAGGDIAIATTAVEQVGFLIEPGGQLFNGPEEGEKWLTGQTNKAWSGMWEYAAPLFNKHLRNAHRTFSCFHATIWLYSLMNQ